MCGRKSLCLSDDMVWGLKALISHYLQFFLSIKKSQDFPLKLWLPEYSLHPKVEEPGVLRTRKEEMGCDK